MTGATAGRSPSRFASTRQPSTPGGPQPERLGNVAAEAFVHEHGVGVDFQRERERLRLAEIEVCVRDFGWDGAGCHHLQPRGQDWMFAQKLGLHGGRDDDAAKECGQQMRAPDLQECRER